MAASEGMGLAPWGSLGSGAFKTTAQREEIARSGNHGRQNPATMRKAPYVVPIVGGRKVEHLLSNIEGLWVDLSDEDLKEIDAAYEFDIGFPMNFLFRGDDVVKEAHPGNSSLKIGGKFDYPDMVRAPRPKKLDA